jgi:molybdopterin-guanine dinucleotide biosynthesis protein A
MRYDATAIVLAGGKSSRMGQDKSLIEIDGEPLISLVVGQLKPYFSRILIGAADDGKFDFLELPVIPDKAPNCGPMMGLASTLEASQDELNFVIACDIPDVNVELMQRLMSLADGYDCVIPSLGNGMHEPLFGVYRKSVLPEASEMLAAGRRRISSLFDRVRVRFVELDESGSCVNLNTQEDLKKWRGSTHDNV